MRKVKSKRPARGSIKKDTVAKKLPGRGERIFRLLFILVLVLSIIFKIYRADRAGIIYDESMTFMHYCNSVHTAVTNFSSTNNHILNSVLIVFAHEFFGSYEHFIRIPSLLAGIMFSLSLAYIVYKTIESPAIRVATLALTSLVPFVFNFSFLARGYAFALAGVFTETALVLWLLEHKIRFRHWLVPVLVISVMNFLAFGAMLSAVLVLAAFNLLFVLFYSYRIYRDSTGRVKAVILNGISVFLISLVFVFPLYHAVYREIPTNKELLKISHGWRGWPSFVNYIDRLFVKTVFDPGDIAGKVILYSFIGLAVVGAGFGLYKTASRVKRGVLGKYLMAEDGRVFIFIFTSLTIVFMFLYGVVLNRSLGLERNSIFLIPLVLLCASIIFDRFACASGTNIAGYVIRVIVIAVMVSVLLYNPLSPVYTFKKGGSISGPLLRKLKSIDPDKVWNIGFSKRMQSNYMGFLYYRQFDYKFSTGSPRPDLILCSPKEVPPEAPRLKWSYLNNTNCEIVVNCPLDRSLVIPGE